MITELERRLACARCHGPLTAVEGALECRAPGCGFRATVADGIVSTKGGDPSFFDATYPIMIHGSDEPGARAAFYSQQVDALRSRLGGARVILDVGCGPRLPYAKPTGALMIGVDLSYESLRVNHDVDVRIYGSAAALPLPSRSVDAVICLYSIHHFVGGSVEDNARIVRGAFTELARVLTPGGHLLVFEVAPWWPAWTVQRLSWNRIRRVSRVLDMFFWRRDRLVREAATALPAGSGLEYVRFRVAPWTMFPPAFALPRLRIPRWLYPFDICLYHWRLAADGPAE